jgi:hypothetical protein
LSSTCAYWILSCKAVEVRTYINGKVLLVNPITAVV